MKRTLKTRVLGSSTLAALTLLAVTSAWPTTSHAADTATVPGNVGGWVGKAQRVGTAAANGHVAIVLHMALRNPDRLQQLVADVSKPGNPQYGKYLTLAGFRSRFAPDPADANAAAALLKNAGMKNVTVGPAGVYVSADATVAQISATFGVTQDLYTFQGRTVRANSQLPSVPASLAGKVLAIEGLDASNERHPNHVSVTEGERHAPQSLRADDTAFRAVTPPPVAANLPSPYCDTYAGDLEATLSTPPAPYAAKLPWLLCGYTPQQVRQAYGLNRVTANGSGVTVAIVDAFASPTLMADGNAYARNHKLPKLTAANFTQIIPEGIYNLPASEVTNAYGWWGEESLDLAAVHGSAPGAKIVYIGAADNGSSLTVALTNAIYNRAADIITNSYSYNGDTDPADTAAQDQNFMAAAATGITLLFSSGDDGDLSQINGIATGAYEADSAYVTGVGGTSLFLRNSGGGKGEWGWGNYRDYLGGATVNSGTSITTSGLETTTAFGETLLQLRVLLGLGRRPQPGLSTAFLPGRHRARRAGNHAVHREGHGLHHQQGTRVARRVDGGGPVHRLPVRRDDDDRRQCGQRCGLHSGDEHHRIL